MARLHISDAAIYGIQNVTKIRPVPSEKYKQLSKEADEQIKQNWKEYGKAYIKAKNCIARGNKNEN